MCIFMVNKKFENSKKLNDKNGRQEENIDRIHAWIKLSKIEPCVQSQIDLWICY